MSPCGDGEVHRVKNFAKKCLDKRVRVARVRVAFEEAAAGSGSVDAGRLDGGGALDGLTTVVHWTVVVC
jgi:hypothetical protein